MNCKVILLFALTTSAAANAADTTIADVKEWYMTAYAPLWAEKTWDKQEEIFSYYASEITYHGADGTLSVEQSDEWLSTSIETWKAEGWLGSDVPAIHVELLNPATATFKSKWRDRYADGSEAFSCGWYLADKIDGAWQFTQYADIECSEHDL